MKFVHVHCKLLATNALLNCVILQLLDFANGVMLQLEFPSVILNCNLSISIILQLMSIYKVVLFVSTGIGNDNFTSLNTLHKSIA